MSDQKKRIALLLPVRQSTALVFDSPHSGRDYPSDFRFSCDMKDLRMAEDMYVDELFAHVTDQGAPLLKALFPRSYIDPNRPLAANDNDNKKPVLRGLFRRVCSGINQTPIYDESTLPTKDEKRRRIETCYKEYHENLSDILKKTKHHFEKAVHINCHSMPSTYGDGARNRYDFILGNRDGRTSSPELIDFIKKTLEDMGYKVGVNIPGYRGAEIIRRHSDPNGNIQSVQLEINRGLYMDERSFKKTENFNKLKRDLRTLTQKLSETATTIEHPSPHRKCRKDADVIPPHNRPKPDFKKP